MNEQQMTATATDILADRKANRPYRRFDGTLDEAYAVQAIYQRDAAKAYGLSSRAGYKIALTSHAMQTMVGVAEPLAGWVFAEHVFANGTTVRLADHQHVGVEFEVAVRLARALPAGESPHTAESVAAAVDGYAPAYELIEDRNADYTQINAFSLVAENCWNAGVIIGEYLPGPVLAEAATELEVNGEAAGQGVAGDALGHPLEAVAWLANQLNRQGSALEAGEFVMTGSSIRTTFPAAGDSYRFTVESLGEVTVSFA